jgi:crotonobetainyl-CoA:carnitine CoA-transferase CaiB-like acyl-CoA transferase
VPVHLSATDWRIERAGPMLGQDNERVLCGLLGVSAEELEELAATGVI